VPDTIWCAATLSGLRIRGEMTIGWPPGVRVRLTAAGIRDDDRTAPAEVGV